MSLLSRLTRPDQPYSSEKYSPLNLRTLRCLETSGSDYPLPQRRIPEESNSQVHRCEKGERGSLVVKALRYKPAGRGFDSRWCHWNFSVT